MISFVLILMIRGFKKFFNKLPVKIIRNFFLNYCRILCSNRGLKTIINILIICVELYLV